MFRDDVVHRREFASYVGKPPYMNTGMRMKSGLKSTAFAPVIDEYAREYKLHNTFLKPDQITDPLDEYWALRRVACLWDVTGEEPLEIAGPEAAALVDELVPRNLAGLRDGTAVFSIMCYDYGGIVEDAILIRFDAQRFWWVGGPGWAEQWIYGHTIERDVSVVSLLDRVHVASIQGPQSRDILQQVCSADLSWLAYFGVVETQVAEVPVVISRTGFSAELGYDIYVPVEHGETMFRTLWETGKPQGMLLAGSRALNIRRTEAGILNVGQDFDWTHNPYEVGLQRMVDLDKPYFHGQNALRDIRERGVTRCIAGLQIDADHALEHGSEIEHDGHVTGRVSSALWSPALERSIAIAMLSIDATEPGTRLRVRTPDDEYSAKVVRMPFLDPERRLARA